jgi:predicted glycoside hydrolase/deacetylase ChbG (UPF0249 family)
VGEPSGWTRRHFIQTAAVVASPLVFHRRFASPTAIDQPLAERLGYAPDARLLIIHADDIGIVHSVNEAAITAIEKGVVNSGSAMVTTPWFPEFAAYARTHPQFDLGLHLTFTSERPSYRWGPVLGPAQVPSLVDADGYFPAVWDEGRPVNLDEMEAEIRAQIDRARLLGVRPTHLDSHEHRLQWLGSAVFERFLRVAREYRLPIRVGRNWFGERPYLASVLEGGGTALDRVISIPPSTPVDQWLAFYLEAIRTLKAGVTELIMHVGYADGELRAFVPASLSYGASWRQRDLDAATSPKLRDALAASQVRLLTWREIARLLAD